MNRKRKQEAERTFTTAIFVDAAVFLIYLIAAGNGIIWLKVISAILTMSISILSLYLLYLRQEFMRPDRLWMTVAAASIFICTLFSLILNFPCPYPQ